MKNLLGLLVLCLGLILNAQLKPEDAIQQYDERFPQEKISILFDKDKYIAGDQIWFNAFVFEGNSRSEISTSLFVELYDAERKLITKKLLPLYKGEGKGSLKLADDLKENIYYLRAYTTWMSNFSEDFIYLRPLAIYNPSAEAKLVKNTVSDWVLTAHPESGTFVDGIETKVAVRLYNAGESPKSWKGIVVDSDMPQKPVTTFQSYDENVGLFVLTPKKGKKYQVVVDDPKGKKISINLPAVLENGVNLKVTNADDIIKYKLTGNPTNQNYKNYKVIGTINNKLVYKAVIKKTGHDLFSIPTQHLINGILQLTVFDESENVIASRLCFVKPNILDVQKPILKDIHQDAHPRKLNQFDIVPQANYSNYTVVVQNQMEENQIEDHNLLSDLWLTGDFVSLIKSPAQYFSKDRNTEALDALLISESWKRFNWKNITSKNYPFIKYKPQPYISYTGSLTINQIAAPNREINLAYKNDNSDLKIIPVKTDNSGNFVMQNMIFEDNYRFSYQLNSNRNSDNPKVFMKPNLISIPYLHPLPKNDYILITRSQNEVVDPEISKSVVAMKMQKRIDEKVNEIEEVKLKVKKKDKTKQLNNELSSSMFRSVDEIVFDFVNDNQSAMGASDLLQWLNGRVAGLQIRREQGQSVPYIREGRAAIYLDEMIVEPSMLNGLSVNDIAMIKVLKGFSAARAGSSIAVYTKRRGSTNEKGEVAPGLTEIILQGYDKDITFNNIDHSTTNTLDILTDVRQVLYWNTNLKSVNNKASTVKFYNNDEPKKHKITIIALDDNSLHVPLYYNEILP